LDAGFVVVTVPPGTTLRTSTGSGSQDIDVDGSVEARSGSGSLKIRRAGELRTNTGSGGVVADAVISMWVFRLRCKAASTGDRSAEPSTAAAPCSTFGIVGRDFDSMR
jgi:hypothetical protein